MDNILLQLLDEYSCRTAAEYENALKEIMQEIALLGLWRAKFYEHALFYGGSALRILYGLPRFSEDLDFSLLSPAPGLDLSKYYTAILKELEGFGLDVELQSKNKSFDSQIDSAFIKAGTKVNFIRVQAPEPIVARLHGNQVIKIKIETDLDPPGSHGVEVKDLFRPIPFQVKTMPIADLFAGKVHALLARSWQTRVKGRDFFDYLWYIGRIAALNLRHLEARLQQSGHLEGPLSSTLLQERLIARFRETDFEIAKRDIAPFLQEREKASLELWCKEYFIDTVGRIRCIA